MPPPAAKKSRTGTAEAPKSDRSSEKSSDKSEKSKKDQESTRSDRPERSRSSRDDVGEIATIVVFPDDSFERVDFKARDTLEDIIGKRLPTVPVKRNEQLRYHFNGKIMSHRHLTQSIGSLAKASQLPTLYVCPVENVLGRVPLIPCYLKGNSHNTIPFSLRQHVPNGAAADSRQDSGTGSRLFEVNIWMWRYGRSFPRKVSVMDAVEMRRERVRESRRRGAATLKRRRLAAASADAAAGRPAE